MEPITTALTFATIISLMSDFKSSRKGGSQDEYNDFLEWLIENNHEQLLSEIKANQRVSIGIKTAINESVEIFQERFDQIDNMLSQLASGLGFFPELAEALKPDIRISKQASSIICQLVESGAERFGWIKIMTGDPDVLNLLGGNKQHIEYDEPKFLKDDLQTITELGLVRLDSGSNGTKFYYITRVAVEYANAYNTV